MQTLIPKDGPKLDLDFPFPTILNANARYITNEKETQKALSRGVVLNKPELCRLLNDKAKLYQLLRAKGINAPNPVRVGDLSDGVSFSISDFRNAMGEEFIARERDQCSHVSSLDELIDFLSTKPSVDCVMYTPHGETSFGVSVAPVLKNKEFTPLENYPLASMTGMIGISQIPDKYTERLVNLAFDVALKLRLDVGTVTMTVLDDVIRVENVTTHAPYSKELVRYLINLKRGKLSKHL
jgi:hypothetical protein